MNGPSSSTTMLLVVVAVVALLILKPDFLGGRRAHAAPLDPGLGGVPPGAPPGRDVPYWIPPAHTPAPLAPPPPAPVTPEAIEAIRAAKTKLRGAGSAPVLVTASDVAAAQGASPTAVRAANRFLPTSFGGVGV